MQPRDSKKFTAVTYRVTNVRVLKMWRLNFIKENAGENTPVRAQVFHYNVGYKIQVGNGIWKFSISEVSAR